MRFRLVKLCVLTLCAALGVVSFFHTRAGRAQKGAPSGGVPPVVPKTWDDKEILTLELPIAGLPKKQVHISADYYYRIPEMKIYKTYPIYAPGREPHGYIADLRHREPEVAFDPSALKTEEDWVKAGELVFNAPVFFDSLNHLSDVRSRKWYEESGVPVASDGTMPYNVYVIRQKGQIEVGEFSCATCHTRVLPDGTVVRGAQGNYPLGKLDLMDVQKYLGKGEEREKAFMDRARGGFMLGYHSPWVKPDTLAQFDALTVQQFAEINSRLPPGVQTRPGVSLFVPVQVPDLIGVKDRRYLDRTGLQLHRSIVDLMRYAALNQGISYLTDYGGYIPRAVAEGGGKLPDPSTLTRYSDAQLYALAKYIYSLKPPPNPNKFDATAARGQKIFRREGCADCHTPPLYTSNKLTPVKGFQIPPEHLKKYDIIPRTVGTDPALALLTRRATGYYKVPSLRGVWYRGPFEHMGSVMTLEDWFDPRRLRDDYVPTGFRGFGVETRAVKGHAFGLDLSEDDRKALIAFLRTL